MHNRYGELAKRLIAVMGLGVPGAGCWTSSPAPNDPVNHGPRMPSDQTHETTTQGGKQTTRSRRLQPGPWGPFEAEPNWGDGTQHCVKKPADSECPTSATLTNSHGTTVANSRATATATVVMDPRRRAFTGVAVRCVGRVVCCWPRFVERDGWTRTAEARCGAMSEEVRAALIEVWLRDAAFEHASIASFARLSLELIALGAPAELVRAAHRAALDEIEHAELALTIASELAGKTLGPAPLATQPTEAPSFAALARDCFRDGCYGETVAVMLARASYDATHDPDLRGVYRQIAAEEQRHAELSFQIVAWAVGRSAEARAVVAEERERLAASEPMFDSSSGSDLTRYGVLAAATEAEVRARTVREVVLPCIDAAMAA